MSQKRPLLWLTRTPAAGKAQPLFLGLHPVGTTPSGPMTGERSHRLMCWNPWQPCMFKWWLKPGLILEGPCGKWLKSQYLYIYMYLYIYIYMYISIYISISIYIYIYIYIYICIYLYISISIYIYLYISIYISIYIYLYMYIYIYISISIYIYISIYVCIYICMYLYLLLWYSTGSVHFLGSLPGQNPDPTTMNEKWTVLSAGPRSDFWSASPFSLHSTWQMGWTKTGNSTTNLYIYMLHVQTYTYRMVYLESRYIDIWLK